MTISDNYSPATVLNSALSSVDVTLPAWGTGLVLDDLEIFQHDLADGTVKQYTTDGGFTVTKDGLTVTVQKFPSFTGNIDVWVTRVTDKDQSYNPLEANSLSPTALAAQLDKTMKTIQENISDDQRVTCINATDLPDKISRKGKLLGFDGTTGD